MSRPARFYYEENGYYYYYDEETCEFARHLAKCKDNTYSYFHLFKDDEQTNTGLLAFRDKFNLCAKEIYEKGGILYKKYYNHYSATELTFKRYSPNAYNGFEDVTFDEYLFIESCHNGGIICLDHQSKDVPIWCHGYDYSSFYPNMLNSKDLLIPRCQGKKVKLEKLDYKNLTFGIYKVKITCNDANFCKIFSFSKKNTYTHYDVQFANKYKTNFNIKIELITDTEYNALIYDGELVPAYTIFGNWFDNLFALKKKCPKNFLLKRLLSSLWGSLTKMEKRYFTEEQMSENLEIGEYELINETNTLINGEIVTRYETIKISKPYKYHFGRLKPFLLAFSRNTVGNLIMQCNIIEHVVRVQTDGIVLDDEYDFSQIGLNYYPIPEAKTSGTRIWENVNKSNLCYYCHNYE
jgi:hypothetical protein